MQSHKSKIREILRSQKEALKLFEKRYEITQNQPPNSSSSGQAARLASREHHAWTIVDTKYKKLTKAEQEEYDELQQEFY